MKKETLKLITEELINAREKFPSSSLCMIALMEEVGDLAKAILSESRMSIKIEAVQVAVMAIRVLEEGDPSTDQHRKNCNLGNYSGNHPCREEDDHDYEYYEDSDDGFWSCAHCGKNQGIVDNSIPDEDLPF